uniref:Uncharacterized protein n=1 Tax=Arundo donax TaxID=35708 RepID=A0A0A8Z3F4_ARUDO
MSFTLYFLLSHPVSIRFTSI